jgi:hypothetical protein
MKGKSVILNFLLKPTSIYSKTYAYTRDAVQLRSNSSSTALYSGDARSEIWQDTRGTHSSSSFFHWLHNSRGRWSLLSVWWSFLHTVGLFGRVISSSEGLYLNIGQHKYRINIHRTSMLWVGFEPTILASERAKTVYFLHGSSTETGRITPSLQESSRINPWLFPSTSFLIHYSLRSRNSRPQSLITDSFAKLGTDILWL